MAINPPLAHSPRRGLPPQTYFEHVTNVCSKAIYNAEQASAYCNGDSELIVSWIAAAALYHDLGKLDSANQAVLQMESRESLPIDHDDAGSAELLKLGRLEAAVLAFGHHKGLFSLHEEMGKQGRCFRELDRIKQGHEKVADRVDRELENYEHVHTAAKCQDLGPVEPSELHKKGLNRRIALSCLVDADYGDTACNYNNEAAIVQVAPRWEERLAALQHYIDRLPAGKTPPEQHCNQLRKRVFEACRDAPLNPPIRTCAAPVGSGKTTAVMAHLLRAATEHKPALRHIIVVLPYTNIITQSVGIYRRALVLAGERPEDVVAEHHHQADFADLEVRQLATLWKAPIIVTTAVQFFETLGNCRSSRLRKLHELPGSAIFVDEVHAAIPSYLWPQMWLWLTALTQNWGCHLVLASGSLPRFWSLDEYQAAMRGNKQAPIPEVPDLVTDDALLNNLQQIERSRIGYRRQPENASKLNCQGVIDFVVQKPGPRLLIVNTVQTAAVIAQAMRDSGHNVLHLSTALAPVHRGLIVERVKLRLQEKIEDWTLVATSCIEAGMNFSFHTGFRERSSTASLIQVGGRVNRGDEFEDAEVWDLLLGDDRLSKNLALTVSRSALDRISVDELNQMRPDCLATCAMSREWTFDAAAKARQLIKDENCMEYKQVSQQCRVIDADTRTVIIDPSLAESVKKGEKVSSTELMKYSVQIWACKIDFNKLALEPLTHSNCKDDSTIYQWPYDYDPDFLGYMKGVLKLKEFISSGGAII
jgi:CRISPR-associated endonuclease/helicase Cas3